MRLLPNIEQLIIERIRYVECNSDLKLDRQLRKMMIATNRAEPFAQGVSGNRFSTWLSTAPDTTDMTDSAESTKASSEISSEH